MKLELTDFDKKVYEIVLEFALNDFTCEPYEAIQILGLEGTDRDFRKERAFAKISHIAKAKKKELFGGISKN